MFLFKTYIAPSPIHGIGVFANERISKGNRIWQLENNFDVVITKQQYELLPLQAKEFIDNFAYYREVEGGYILCSDNAKYTNHSNNPNTEMDELYTYALKDIEIGEEITEDYFKFDEEASGKLKQLGTYKTQAL